MSEIVLASASPRRKELLENMGIEFSVIVSDADESAIDSDVPPEIYVQELALIKAVGVAEKIRKSRDVIIIAADTVVVCDDEIMGKPDDEAHAFELLSKLSGREHSVYTGICVLRIRDAYTVCKSVRTDVAFKELSDDKINGYIRTGEPMDKAGAYGIQGMGAMLISGISGDYFNVVGLPVSELSDVLEKDFDFKLI